MNKTGCTTINLYKAGCNCFPACAIDDVLLGYHIELAAKNDEVERLKELVRKHSNDAMNYHADVEKANDAFEWLERKVFEGKWDGTLGAPKSWHMAGPYRHELVKMRGNTLLEAIYNAMKEET